MVFSQNLLENDKNPKKKKKKKTKKKNKTPENFTLFDKKPCCFSENPDKDKSNFCEIWDFSQNLSKNLIENAIKVIFFRNSEKNNEKLIKETNEKNCTPLNENKMKESISTPPNKEKEHRIVEHIEHRKNMKFNFS